MGHHHSKSKKEDSKLKKQASDYETLVQDMKNGKSDDEDKSENDATDLKPNKSRTTAGANVQVVSMCHDDEFIEELIDNSHATDDPSADDYKDIDETDHLPEKTTTQSFISSRSQPRKIKNFASALSGPGKDYIEIESDLKNDLDKNALSVKEQTLFSSDSQDGDSPESEGSPSKRRYKSQRSKNPMKRLFSRTSGIKIAPIDNMDGHNTVMDVRSKILRTPSYIFDIAIIPPPPEFGDDELTETENEKIYGWLAERRLTQVPVSNDNQTDPEYITVTQLYNSMSDGQKSCYLLDPTFLLLIDTRCKEKYEKQHITTACHITELIENHQAFEPIDQYTFVVLYDDDGLSYSLTDSELSQAMEELISRKADAYVLAGGFDAFYSYFPYFCTREIPTSEAERQSLVPNYPSIIVEDQLVLGRVDQATNEKAVRNLGISHIVCITEETTMPFKDFITYHHVKLSDEPSTSLHHCFPETIRFMQDAIERGGKVLVHCNLGQSRSSTVATAYLMFTRQWSLHDAYGFVKEHRPVVHPNEGFMNQLSNFERVLYGKRITNIELYGYNTVSLKASKQKVVKKKEKKKNIKKIIKKEMLGYDSLSEDDNDLHSEEIKEKDSEKGKSDEDDKQDDEEDDFCKCDDSEPSISENVNQESVSVPVISTISSFKQGNKAQSQDDSESALLLEDDNKGNEDDFNHQRNYVSTPFIHTEEDDQTAKKEEKKPGTLKHIIVVSSGDSSDVAGKRAPNNVHAGDDISLIGDLNEEINSALKGISNVALESENAVDKAENKSIVETQPNEITEITNF